MRLTNNSSFTFRQLTIFIWLSLVFLNGCVRLEPIATNTPMSNEPLQATPSPFIVATTTPDYGWTDANFLMERICFEAAEKRLGQVYIIRNSVELAELYSQIDRSRLCEEPIKPATITFRSGDVLVGLWSGGKGCTAEHLVQNIQRNDTGRQIAIQLQLVIYGNCPYELIRPFWVILKEAEGYNIQVNVASSPQ